MDSGAGRPNVYELPITGVCSTASNKNVRRSLKDFLREGRVLDRFGVVVVSVAHQAERLSFEQHQLRQRGLPLLTHLPKKLRDLLKTSSTTKLICFTTAGSDELQDIGHIVLSRIVTRKI